MWLHVQEYHKHWNQRQAYHVSFIAQQSSAYRPLFCIVICLPWCKKEKGFLHEYLLEFISKVKIT